MHRMQERPAAIWFEVEDFLRYFDHYANPTGIQRVSFEIFGAAHQLSGEDMQVKFFRLSMYTGRFEQVSFEQISSAYTTWWDTEAPWNSMPLPRRPWREWGLILRATAHFPRYVGRVFGYLFRDLAKVYTPGDEKKLAPGDVIVSLGSSWLTHNFCGYIRRLKRNQEVRFVQLVHDVIPILYPNWTPWFRAAFNRWIKHVTSVADMLLTISQNSRRDLESYALVEGFALPPLRTIRYGTGLPSGFGLRPRTPSAGGSTVTRSLPEQFVLCVSTIEDRKNHELLLTVWGNLLAAHGPSKVPHLVLVGRVGYFAFDTGLRAKLLDKRFCQRIIAAGVVKDAELAEAYRRCLFTVFPSFYEGWGLPVEESLAHGKFCIASNSSSMPEVGEDWVDYFDPRDATDAQRVLERALFEPCYVEARERRIRAHYRPSSWRDCARQLIQYAEGLTEAGVAPEACTGSPTRESTSS
jgi:glycosyltransferase involved in cell wall biosynthesis